MTDSYGFEQIYTYDGLNSKTITFTLAELHVIHFVYDEEMGLPAGSFFTAMMAAMFKAHPLEFRRLALLYPELCNAITAYRYGDLIERVEKAKAGNLAKQTEQLKRRTQKS